MISDGKLEGAVQEKRGVFVGTVGGTPQESFFLGTHVFTTRFAPADVSSFSLICYNSKEVNI